MVITWFRRRQDLEALTFAPGFGRLPEGRRIYAIGDIHGRADLLDRMLLLIAGDARSSPSPHIVFLGDYVDRGPDSAAVLERLCHWDHPVPCTFLRGNHEDMLLAALTDPEVLGQWRRFGGMETLASYRVPVAALLRGQGLEEARLALDAGLPAPHRAFLEAGALHWSEGGYYFCHAGCRPGIRLERQTSADLLWIREEFLEAARPFEKFIVHGHTPVAEPDVRDWRINVDTGAYASGILTAAVIEGTSRRFLQARGDA